MDGDGLDYEAIRQENIRKNAELMLSLGLDTKTTRMRPPSPERKPSLARKRRSPSVPEEEKSDLPARKSSRLARGQRKSLREQDLHPRISRDKVKKEKVYREGSRKSGRSSGSRAKYVDWDSDEDDDSDAYIPKWNEKSSRSRHADSSRDDDDDDSQDGDNSQSRNGPKTFDLLGRPVLKKISNPSAPPLPKTGGDIIYTERAALPGRERAEEGKGRGALLFEEEYDQFRPNVTPAEMLRGGAFGGTAFRDYFSKVLQRQIDVEAELAELPDDWLEGLDVDDLLRSPQLDPSKNKFKVKAGQPLEEWEKSGWIQPLDPRGWFQWYYRFYLGRRSADDARQIGRWLKACGPGGRFRKALAQNVAAKGGRWDDPKVNPVVRQTLWQWGYELTYADYMAYHT